MALLESETEVEEQGICLMLVLSFSWRLPRSFEVVLDLGSIDLLSDACPFVMIAAYLRFSPFPLVIFPSLSSSAASTASADSLLLLADDDLRRKERTSRNRFIFRIKF